MKCIYSYSLRHHLLIVKDEKQHKCPSAEYWLINAGTSIHVIYYYVSAKRNICSPGKKVGGKKSFLSVSTGILHFVFLCYTSHILCILQIEDFWQPFVDQICRCHFPNSICSFCVSMSHVGNSQNISSIFIIICVMVICEQCFLMLLL